MPSHLRLQSSFGAPVSANATYQTSPTSRPAKKQKMSLTQTYFVASTARSKLGKEAGRADHNLHRLVTHANLLDSLMVELADAEREQEAWFNQSVRTASRPEERRVQWVDTIAEEFDEEESDDESEDGSDVDDEEMFDFHFEAPKNIKVPAVSVSSSAIIDEDEDAEFDEESDDDSLALRRTPSRNACPSLLEEEEEDSDSEDDECPSPQNTPLQLCEKERKAIATTAFYDVKSQQGLSGYVLQQPQQPLIAAC